MALLLVNFKCTVITCPTGTRHSTPLTYTDPLFTISSEYLHAMYVSDTRYPVNYCFIVILGLRDSADGSLSLALTYFV